MNDLFRARWSGQLFLLFSFVLMGAVLGQIVLSSLAQVLGIGNLSQVLDELKAGNYLETLPFVKILLIGSHLFSFTLPALAYAYWWEKGPHWKRFFGPMQNVPRGTFTWLLPPVLTFLGFPILLAGLWLNSLWAGVWQPDSLQTLLMDMQSPLDFVLNFLLIAVVAGIGEELLFRGIIQRIFVRAGLPIALSITLAALLFSVGHFDSPALLPRLLFGAFFGYFYQRSQRIWIPILAHITHNGWQLTAAYLSHTPSTQNQLEWATWHLLVLFPFVVLLYFYHQQTRPNHELKNP